VTEQGLGVTEKGLGVTEKGLGVAVRALRPSQNPGVELSSVRTWLRRAEPTARRELQSAIGRDT
jgi:hypothetical protein